MSHPDHWLGADQHGVVRAVDLTALSEAIRESWHDTTTQYMARRYEFARIVGTIAAGVSAGSAESVDDAIWFLDADPWCIYSGDAKAKIMRRVVSAPITDTQRDRLAAIVLAAVDIGWRWEFPETVKLARRIGGRTLRVGLRVRLHAADLAAARRAAIALVRLRRPRLTEQDLRRAREVVISDLRDLADHDRDMCFTWSARTARSLMDADWLAELRREAVGDGANRHPARAILYQMSREGRDHGTSPP